MVSTESIARPSRPDAPSASCASCGAPLAQDQRYCLECGERQVPTSSVLLAGPPTAAGPPGASDRSKMGPPGQPSRSTDSSWDRGSALTVIAGVGVLLLAMGVGVLIGRAGNSKTTAAPQVISVASTPTGTSSTARSEAPLADDWPPGKAGFTVQLKTLAKSGTTVSAVEAAETQASAKGAKGVGALKSEDFSSLSAGSYVIYSGVYDKKAQAERALPGLKKSFPGASVIKVSNPSSSSSSHGSNTSSGAGSSLSHPAPPSVVESLKKVKGKNYEERSKNLPDVISTG
jgi:hypothetical protein